MPGDHTHLNLRDVEDAAPPNGFGDRWEARVAREPLGAEHTGVSHFWLKPGKRSPFVHRHERSEEIYVIVSGGGRAKLGEEVVEVVPRDAIRVPPDVTRAFEAGPDGLEFIALGAHVASDGVPVDDPWVE